jgi:hypothetical protein
VSTRVRLQLPEGSLPVEFRNNIADTVPHGRNNALNIRANDVQVELYEMFLPEQEYIENDPPGNLPTGEGSSLKLEYVTCAYKGNSYPSSLSLVPSHILSLHTYSILGYLAYQPTMTPTLIPSSTTMSSTQTQTQAQAQAQAQAAAAASLSSSHVEKAESTMSSMTNASTDKTLNSDSDTKQVSSSVQRAEATKTGVVHLKPGMTHPNAGAVNPSTSAAEANSKNSSLKNARGSEEESDESSSFEEKPSFSRHQNTKDKDKDKDKDRKKRKARAVSSHSSSGASSFPSKTKTSTSQLHSMTHKKQKLQDDGGDDDDDDDSVEDGDYDERDPTTKEGQMFLNPNMTSKAACTEAKREYNRRNAARARKRNKHMVGDLQGQVHSLTRRADSLQRSNDVLQAQLEVLQSQNRDLLVSRKDSSPKVQVQPSNDIMSQLFEQLQEKSEAQEQVQSITQLLNTLNGQGSSSQILSSLQGAAGRQVGANNMLAGMSMPGQGGNSHRLSTLLGQAAQQQTQTFRPQPELTNPHIGLQGGQSMSQLLSSFGLQGQQQQRSQPQHHVYDTSHDQQSLQQLLTSMPTEMLYNMLHDSSRTGNNDLNAGRR